MVSMKELMSTAYKNHFAIPAVNVENADMLEGVISGAARVRAPVIIQLTEPAAEAFGAGYAAYLAKYFAAKFDVPVGLHLDHASNEEIIMDCAAAGFTSVMLDFSECELSEIIKKSRQIMAKLKGMDIAIEAEIGLIGSMQSETVKTDIEDARFLCGEVGCDMLAPSVGNVHGLSTKSARLDFDLLRALHSELGLPIVLHGSSGTVEKDLELAVDLGVTKVNFETEYRRIFQKTLMETLVLPPKIMKPREVLGVLRKEVSDRTEEKCRILRCCNKADLFRHNAQ
ncbi:class II fructose-bisphosphate aldolase [Clostridiaceae bacterium]|nr:class II fructose-bisphosphate aldolase [Clostridiaceae bacterium]RKJ82984.1 class II fructose-bisphosphate aldolase [Butyricicoccus sp. 1XD8-22]